MVSAITVPIDADEDTPEGCANTEENTDTVPTEAAAETPAATTSPVIDTVAVLRLDRAFRSVVDMHNVLAELEGRGIRFAAITQPIDTGTPVGKLLITVLGGVAEFERDMISERVKEGLARAKRQGIKLGRKRKPLSPDRAAIYLEKFGNPAAAAAALGVSRSTLYSRIKERPINLPDVSFLEP